jgi:hypothetical protein
MPLQRERGGWGANRFFQALPPCGWTGRRISIGTGPVSVNGSEGLKMASGFAWLNELMVWLGRWVPRLLLIKRGHCGVKFGPGGSLEQLDAGLHILLADYA